MKHIWLGKDGVVFNKKPNNIEVAEFIEYADYDRRVTELLEANNRLLEDKRALQQEYYRERVVVDILAELIGIRRL